MSTQITIPLHVAQEARDALKAALSAMTEAWAASVPARGMDDLMRLAEIHGALGHHIEHAEQMARFDASYAALNGSRDMRALNDQIQGNTRNEWRAVK